MSASFTITLDTSPPATPGMVIEDGATHTGTPVVRVVLTSGTDDVEEMKIWGDVAPATDPRVQELEADSDWILFDPDGLYVELSGTDERKHIYARLRDDVGNTTPVFSDHIDLDTTRPWVSITTPADRALVSLVDGFDTSTFAWESNVAYDQFEVRVVPSPTSPRTQGNVVASGGAGGATTPVITGVTGADLLAASVGDGPKVVKVFVRTGALWSA